MQNTKREWAKTITKFYSRRSLVNYDLAVDIVRKLGYPETYGPHSSILDVYAGTSVFSAALHNEIKPKTHIIMEPYPSYLKFLSTLANPPKIYAEGTDPYRWSTFQSLIEDGKFVPETQPRNTVHNGILFVGNLLHGQGEQLVNQYLNCVSNSSWIERFGRVRLLLWMRSSVAEKLLAGPGELFRSRISLQRESSCDARVVMHTPSPKFAAKPRYPLALQSPLVGHWNPAKDFVGRSGHDISLIELTPKETQVEHVEELEYVNKMIFILRSTTLRSALNSLGPGAVEDLGPRLTDLLDLLPTELTADQMVRIADEFWRWPFKPETLFDFYEEENMGIGRSEETRH